MEIPAHEYPKVEGYNILEPIGRGGMGVVFRARQESTGRAVAMKFLKEPDSQPRARFMREIRICLMLSHPNIIEFLDCGERGSLIYFSMELIEGKTLHEILANSGKYPVPDLLAVASQTLAALEHCHGNGVLHRDVKPNNIMRDRHDRVVLMDLGLARSEGMSLLTRTGALMGTPRYMAPELIIGESPTAASDLYALGVSLFELATGRPPFNGRNLVELAHNVTHLDVPSLASERPDLPATFCETVEAMMGKDPAKRPSLDVARARLEAEPVPERERRPAGVPPEPRMPAVPAERARRAGEVAAAGDAGRAGDAGQAPGASGARRESKERRRTRRRTLPGLALVREISWSAWIGMSMGLLAAALFLVMKITTTTTPEPSRSPALVAAPPTPAPSPAAPSLSRRLNQLLAKTRVADDRADALPVGSGTEEILHQSLVMLGELRTLLEDVRARGETGETWLTLENVGGRVVRYVQDHADPERHPGLKAQLELLLQSVTPTDPSPTFKGCFERLMSQRLRRLVDEGVQARMHRLEVHVAVCDILDRQDPAWRDSLRGYSYRMGLLQAVSQLSGTSRFLEREYERSIDPARFHATRLRLLELAEKAIGLCTPRSDWTDRDLGGAGKVLECATEVTACLLAEHADDLPLRARCEALANQAAALEPAVKEVTERPPR